jgi:hypothetical protein
LIDLLQLTCILFGVPSQLGLLILPSLSNYVKRMSSSFNDTEHRQMVFITARVNWFIRSRIASMENDKARDMALLASSKIILAVSFQDSGNAIFK